MSQPQVIQEPAAPAPAPAPANVAMVKLTPAQLYQQYAANEVATDQALAGKIIQITAPVKSIDKDFSDAAVLQFSTGDEFSQMGVTLNDSEKVAAARLSRGQVVTVSCKIMRRIMDSPMGSDCIFLNQSQAANFGQHQNQPTGQAQDETSRVSACDRSASPAACKQEALDQLFAKMDQADLAKRPSGPGQQTDAEDPQYHSAHTNQYLAAIQGAVTRHWVKPNDLTNVPCVVHIVQSRGGELLSAAVDPSCPYNDAERHSVEEAVRQAAPLPYEGFESVFQRNIDLAFRG